MIIWTNGCFDTLHRGHLEMFKYAKSLGDKLVVGIDSDDKVKNDKGLNRPFNNVEDRKFVLECIKYIDEVVIFNSRQDLEDEIKHYTPDIMVIGSDWTELKFFDRIGEYSTTNIVESMK